MTPLSVLSSFGSNQAMQLTAGRRFAPRHRDFNTSIALDARSLESSARSAHLE